jgi:hypothetical protein
MMGAVNKRKGEERKERGGACGDVSSPAPEAAVIGLFFGSLVVLMHVDTVEHLPTLLGEVDEGVVERVNDEAGWHQIKSVVAGANGQADPGGVVAPVALLQLEHAAPQVGRLVGAHGLAAALGRGAGLAGAGAVAMGKAVGDAGGVAVAAVVAAAAAAAAVHDVVVGWNEMMVCLVGGVDGSGGGVSQELLVELLDGGVERMRKRFRRAHSMVLR